MNNVSRTGGRTGLSVLQKNQDRKLWNRRAAWPRTAAPTLLLLLLSIQPLAVADDWPVYQHDIRRSGYTSEQLATPRLRQVWAWQSPVAPQTAWAGPAKWDAYAGQRDLPSMRAYDVCFHPILIGDRVYFGSSVDDTLYCLEAKSGRTLWTYTANGPIRTAPTYVDNRLLFGSDDGHAYCLKADDGSLLWRFSPANTDKLIVNNGRFIPLHPCRTGILVDQGKAYFGAALLPWKSAYLCSVDLNSGLPEGPGCYVKQLAGATLEGPPAATSQLLVFPQGRVAPRIFRRTDGDDQGSLKKSSGGSLVVVSLDAGLFHGPGANSRKGGINQSNPKTREVVAGHGRGNALVVSQGKSFMLTDDALIASDLIQRKSLWSIPCDQPYAMIGAGDVLFVGGRDEVVAYRVKDGELVWRATVAGNVYGLAAAHGRLIASTDTGSIHLFAPGETAVNQTAEAGEEFQPQPVASADEPGLQGRWVFQRPHLTGRNVNDLAGSLPAQISGHVKLQRAHRLQALELDGQSQSVLVHADHKLAKLPSREISAEAWVRIDASLEWGGIVGAIQDNGSYERGWLLGFRSRRFSFALAGMQGSGSLTYLMDENDFDLGRWYHVAASYDGTTMKLFVDGEPVAESDEQSGDINYPPKAFFEIAAYHDQDEEFRLKGQLHEVRLYNRVLSHQEIRSHVASVQPLLPAPAPQVEELQLAAGPWLQFTTPTTALIRWRSRRAVPTVLEYRDHEGTKRIVQEDAGTEHEVTLSGLRPKRLYTYVIQETHGDRELTSAEYECDTFFNFSPPFYSTASQSAPADVGARQAAQQILQRTGIDRGICLILGGSDHNLAAELLTQSRLRLVVVDDSAERVLALRKKFLSGKVYGSRVVVRQVERLSELPFVDHCANLVVGPALNHGEEQADQPAHSAALKAEVRRLLRPDGGVAYVTGAVTTAENLRRHWPGDGIEVQVVDDGPAPCGLIVRSALPGAGDWTHQYGRSDNSAFGGEELAGVQAAGDLAVQWIGRPGPRFKPDRNGRKPSPLATGGRLFIQGLKRIAALDSYNGTVLWSLEIPDLQRFNIPRDCSNWCADRNHVWIAVRDKCWQLAAADGSLVRMHDMRDTLPGTDGFDWGAVISLDYQLIGTAVKPGTAWTNFWGGADAGWYDARTGEVTHKVCADHLFAIDKNSGNSRWKYARGLIINSTITAHENRIYFVESRNDKALQDPQRRAGSPDFWQDQYLVALDAYSGEVVWERPLDIEDGKVVFYLAGGSQERLVIVASTEKKFHVYGFSTADGSQSWSQSAGWIGGKGDHGKAMSRPAIVGDRVFVRPYVFQLSDGKRLPQQMPGGGCGTYACSQHSVFFRASTVTIWDQASGRSSGWKRLRPDCWLSAIPAAGMLLSPEGGGGCSCGSWMETSVGFMPLAHRVGD